MRQSLKIVERIISVDLLMMRETYLFQRIQLGLDVLDETFMQHLARRNFMFNLQTVYIFTEARHLARRG